MVQSFNGSKEGKGKTLDVRRETIRNSKQFFWTLGSERLYLCK
jgi:hypothetical protein